MIAAGTYTLKLAVADVATFSSDSALFVGLIPEPMLRAQQLGAIAMLVLLSRERRRARCRPAA